MKFAHMADCHIGGWVEPKMRELNNEAFVMAMDKCIDESVDFVLISGDLFNTSLPSIDSLKMAVQKLKEAKDTGIPVYIIPGSHDFSPTGKTMIDVLCEAGLCINVVRGEVIDNRLKLKFTTDKNTGAKITGMLGKKGMLEKSYYESLDKHNLESEDGYRIFMFHTALTELKPKELEKMDSSPVSFLPKGFDYYAGGHVHIVRNASLEGYSTIVYPGPLFPNNFREMEELGAGGFYIVDEGKAAFHKVMGGFRTHGISLDCDNMSAESVEQELHSKIKGKDFLNTIVLIRLKGVLSSGKPSDIRFRDMLTQIYDLGAYFVMKNTYALSTAEFEEIKIASHSVEEIENTLIKEHLGQASLMSTDPAREEKFTKMLISVLDTERKEGERVTDFEARIRDDMDRVMMQEWKE